MQTNLIDMINDSEKERLEVRKLKELYSKVVNARCIDTQEMAQQRLDNFLYKNAKYRGYELN